MRWRRLFAIFVSLSSVTAFGRPYTGTYAANHRPHSLEFLSLTHTDRGITGYLLSVEPDTRGGTKSQTVTLDGEADGNVVTLRPRGLFGLPAATWTCRLTGAVLTISYPTDSGAVAADRFVRTSEEQFNSALAAWQSELKIAHARRQRADAQRAARQEKSDLAIRAFNDLRDSVGDLNVRARQLDGTMTFASDLAGLRSDLDSMRSTAREIGADITEGTHCQNLPNRISYLEDQLAYLRDARSFVTDRESNAADAVKDLDTSRREVAERINVLDRATATDPTHRVPPKYASELATTARNVVSGTGVVSTRLLSRINAARRDADAVVAKGVALVTEMKQAVAKECPPN